ncbi:hypothetical protein CWS43_14315 [Rahnella sp. AA]|uniref:AvrD family protein n=1 Tax=Rahnella sp. AA TaxID=2057180 RepID=UPI000C3341AE|nr:AvrD family protein [Rahnella sp. AA]PKE29916.1 hypothetical protein CWS43_14315 [Rahnella sp. AA]
MKSKKKFSSVDEILGPSENRFFSSGYRCSEHKVSNLTFPEPGENNCCLEATVSFFYPSNWSVKNAGMDVTPHLSTIDMLVLAMQMVETHLSFHFGLSMDDLDTNHVNEIAIHAGTKPQEDLNDIPVSLVLRRSVEKTDDSSRKVSTYECRVGLMRAVCQIEHPFCGKENNKTEINSLDNLNIKKRYYGLGYKEQKHILSAVYLDMANLTADAQVEFIFSKEESQVITPEKVSYIDVFVTCAQLAQVLLYSLDGLSRSETSTLWMIRTNFSEDAGEIKNHDKVKTLISTSQIIELNGKQWRNAEVLGTLGNKKAKITFAHALPSIKS